jgi:LEA14-like dessication related protein
VHSSEEKVIITLDLDLDQIKEMFKEIDQSKKKEILKERLKLQFLRETMESSKETIEVEVLEDK